MFHVELRQFPHQTRSFNLTRDELDARILRPWLSGAAVDLDGRRWSPDRAKLTIYEGPELDGGQLGLGRGWANVTREGEDVTDGLLAAVAHPPPLVDFKREVLARCSGEPLGLGRLVELAGARYPQSRVSERIALCEQAVWELLHSGDVQLLSAGVPVAGTDWQATLLDWRAWRAGAVAIQSV